MCKLDSLWMKVKHEMCCKSLPNAHRYSGHKVRNTVRGKIKIKQTEHLSTGSFTADFLLQYCTNFLLQVKSMIFLPLYSVNLVTQLTGQKITNIFIKLPFLQLCCGKVLVNHLKCPALLIQDA